eukprot:TRINITY_DN364_c0_g1_i2.p1 TRINITY_DN364_c0_g1~~TRINITY_DN364_c0_g1_i2.p1  ORF type:complete len:435 (+),score=158.62 TRINITY_DN364_c0_g1_i2:135-1307(+)
MSQDGDQNDRKRTSNRLGPNDDIDDTVQDADNGTFLKADEETLANRKIVRVKRKPSSLTTSSEEAPKSSIPSFSFVPTEQPAPTTSTTTPQEKKEEKPVPEQKPQPETNNTHPEENGKEKATTTASTPEKTETTTPTTTTTNTPPTTTATSGFPQFSFPAFKFPTQLPTWGSGNIFGSTNSNAFQFSFSTPPPAPSKKEEEEEGGDDNGETENPPSPPPGEPTKLPKVDVITGEEDEVVVYSVRAKLFTSNKEVENGAWKERGVGLFKINLGNADSNVTGELNSNKARLVMRAEGAKRLMLNVGLFPAMSVDRAADKQIKFIASEKAGTFTTFLVRVARKDQADELLEALINTKKGLNSTSTPVKSTTTTTTTTETENGEKPVEATEETA